MIVSAEKARFGVRKRAAITLVQRVTADGDDEVVPGADDDYE